MPSMVRPFVAAMVSIGLLVAAEAANIKACPVPLLTAAPAAEDGLQLHGDGLRFLAGLPSPLYLVPTLGVYRGGKSLLLCRLMQLHAPYAGGFAVGHGQETFTRGIQICPEEVRGLGTVVWMDTEGLFSSEDAHGSYGPKIFSLALLFSSVVLLNSVKVLSDQFFAFFAEQQQIARVLKQGLVAEGLPPESLLPGNMSIFWVLQQPVQFDRPPELSEAQLLSFLSLPGDEARARVRRDFRHFIHDVPVASHDSRTWGRLDTLPDSELAEGYVEAAGKLRGRVLEMLRAARPMQASSVAKQLEMYLQVVQTQNFSGSLAKDAFEEGELGSICANFSVLATAFAAPLPSLSLETAVDDAYRGIAERRASIVEGFHLNQAWSIRLDECLKQEVLKLQNMNADAVLGKWQTAVGRVAEGANCFFLGELAALLKEYTANYTKAFSSGIRKQAVEYASALQRARLAECVRLRDALVPFGPWLAWPLCSMYLRTGLFSGFLAMLLHAVLLIGIYAVLNVFNQLPGYLDVNYPVLRMHPIILDIILRAPTCVPWPSVLRIFSAIGTVRSALKFLQHMLHIRRSPGAGHTVAQMVNLELKLNILLKRSEAAFKQQLASVALDAGEHIENGRVRQASISMLRGVSLVRDLSVEQHPAATALSEHHRSNAQLILQRFELPPHRMECKLSTAWQENSLVDSVASGSSEDILQEMIRLLETMLRHIDAADSSSPGASDGREACSQSSVSDATSDICEDATVGSPTATALNSRPMWRRFRASYLQHLFISSPNLRASDRLSYDSPDRVSERSRASSAASRSQGQDGEEGSPISVLDCSPGEVSCLSTALFSPCPEQKQPDPSLESFSDSVTGSCMFDRFPAVGTEMISEPSGIDCCSDLPQHGAENLGIDCSPRTIQRSATPLSRLRKKGSLEEQPSLGSSEVCRSDSPRSQPGSPFSFGRAPTDASGLSLADDEEADDEDTSSSRSCDGLCQSGVSLCKTLVACLVVLVIGAVLNADANGPAHD